MEIPKDKKDSEKSDDNQQSDEKMAEELPLEEEEGNLQEKMNGTQVESELEVTLNFEKEPEEEWIDTVNRGIEVSFKDENDDALQWLITQSNLDNDNEIQIAHGVISRWLDSRSNTSRKKGAKIVALLAKRKKRHLSSNLAAKNGELHH